MMTSLLPNSLEIKYLTACIFKIVFLEVGLKVSSFTSDHDICEAIDCSKGWQWNFR